MSEENAESKSFILEDTKLKKKKNWKKRKQQKLNKVLKNGLDFTSIKKDLNQLELKTTLNSFQVQQSVSAWLYRG